MNEDVSFQHVVFLVSIRHGNLHHNVPIKPTFTFAITKKNCIFFLSFILYLNTAKFHMYIMQKFSTSIFFCSLILSFLFNPLMSFSRTSRARN